MTTFTITTNDDGDHILRTEAVTLRGTGVEFVPTELDLASIVTQAMLVPEMRVFALTMMAHLSATQAAVTDIGQKLRTVS
jgi:hypothetical protein